MIWQNWNLLQCSHYWYNNKRSNRFNVTWQTVQFHPKILKNYMLYGGCILGQKSSQQNLGFWWNYQSSKCLTEIFWWSEENKLGNERVTRTKFWIEKFTQYCISFIKWRPLTNQNKIPSLNVFALLLCLYSVYKSMLIILIMTR